MIKKKIQKDLFGETPQRHFGAFKTPNKSGEAISDISRHRIFPVSYPQEVIFKKKQLFGR